MQPVEAGSKATVQSTDAVPLVSIVIPAFNVAAYLRACLTSVLREVDAARALGKADFEIVVVDDCSKDATGSMARDLLAGREDARVITHERNSGPAAARNTGLDASRGDYVLFLDSDNTLLEGASARVVDALFEHADADVIILGMDLIDEHDERIGLFYGGRIAASPLRRLESNPLLLLDGNIMDAFGIIRARAARTARYDESLCQLSDWDFWLRLYYEHRCRFAMLEASVGGYRVHAGQMSEVHTPKTKSFVREMLRIYAKALALAVRENLPAPAVRQLIANVQKAGAAYAQFSADSQAAARPSQQQVTAAAPRGQVNLSMLQLNFGTKTVPFAFRADSEGDNRVISHVFKNNDYNVAQWGQGRRFLDYYAANVEKKPGLIIDAGANIGASAVYFLESFRNGVVCAIEPDVGNFRILELNTRSYQNKVNFHAAIAAEDGEIRTASPSGGVKTRAISVPSILKATSAAAPMILKCDIEGGEDDLFSGDSGWLRLFPLIIIELHDWLLPFSGTSRNFVRTVAQHDFDLVHRGDEIFLFNRELLAGKSE